MPYQNGSSYDVPFVVSQVHGRWGTGRPVPELAVLDTGDNATVAGLSCASPGNCTTDSQFTGPTSRTAAFLVFQVRGTWARRSRCRGLTALGPGAAVFGISCSAPGRCTEVGTVDIRLRWHTSQAAFAVSQNAPHARFNGN